MIGILGYLANWYLKLIFGRFKIICVTKRDQTIVPTIHKLVQTSSNQLEWSILTKTAVILTKDNFT